MSDQYTPPKVPTKIMIQKKPLIEKKSPTKIMIQKKPLIEKKLLVPGRITSIVPHSSSIQTITITFGNRAENNVGMEMIGKDVPHGFDHKELMETMSLFEEKGTTCELIHLNEGLEGTGIVASDAYCLIIRSGLDLLLDKEGAADRVYTEQVHLPWDKKAKMYGRVVNKHSQHNLCYAEFNQEPDYQAGKGRVIQFDDLPQTKAIRKELGEVFSKKAENLVAEGNHYYDVNKCYIGWHGDAERKIVIAMKLGASMPMHYQWYIQSKPIGKRITRILNHGDMYVMSDKAVGYDWRKKKIPTLRHAAGYEKVVDRL